MTDARKVRIPADEAWDFLLSAKKVAVAKGKKVQHFDIAEESRDEILKRVMGPTGNMRSPTLKSGETVIVGFNLELYQEWLDA